jgi:hypothetical protein
MTRSKTATYEDNFGFYDLKADELEAAFMAHVKASSRATKCRRCRKAVRLLPKRTHCARCLEALEFGGGQA